VSPADLSLVMVWMKRNPGQGQAESTVLAGDEQQHWD